MRSQAGEGEERGEGGERASSKARRVAVFSEVVSDCWALQRATGAAAGDAVRARRHWRSSLAGLADGELWESRDHGDSRTAAQLDGDTLAAVIAFAPDRAAPGAGVDDQVAVVLVVLVTATNDDRVWNFRYWRGHLGRDVPSA